jgi:hypothetical protein
MEKIIAPHAWDFGVATTELIKLSSRGLRGGDLSQFVKRSGHEFADRLRDLRVPEGVVPVHQIALGCTEKFGPNRNGDGFKAAACRKYHDTFVKHARPFRHHNNKRSSPYYGLVKESWFNEPMGRVELLLFYNGTEKAAEEQGGLVADQELQKLERGEEISGSMACTIPFDKCSSCGNEAPSRNEYCTEETCIGPHGEKRGGVRHNMMKVCEDGHVLHVDNPDPDFFDISMVTRPADRIAYGARADYLQKAASGGVLSGAELAEQWGVTLSPGTLAARGDVIGELARLERELSVKSASDRSLIRALRVDRLPLSGKTAEDRSRWLRAAHDAQVLLPLSTIASWFHTPEQEKFAQIVESAAACLPGIFGRAALDPSYLHPEFFQPSSLPSTQLKQAVMDEAAASYGLHEHHLRERISRSVIEQWPAPAWRQPVHQKQASADPIGEQLARHYASYQLAWLTKLAADSPEFALTARACVLQNGSVAPQ